MFQRVLEKKKPLNYATQLLSGLAQLNTKKEKTFGKRQYFYFDRPIIREYRCLFHWELLKASQNVNIGLVKRLIKHFPTHSLLSKHLKNQIVFLITKTKSKCSPIPKTGCTVPQVIASPKVVHVWEQIFWRLTKPSPTTFHKKSQLYFVSFCLLPCEKKSLTLSTTQHEQTRPGCGLCTETDM